METANLVWGLIFSSAGIGYFMYGKRTENLVVRYVGLALMIYPYFIDKVSVLVVVGVILLLLPKFIRV